MPEGPLKWCYVQLSSMGGSRCEGEKLFIPLFRHRGTKASSTKMTLNKYSSNNNKGTVTDIGRYIYHGKSYSI